MRRVLPLLAVDLVFVPAIVWLVATGRGRDAIGVGSLTQLHALIAAFVACAAVVAWHTLLRPPRDAMSRATVWERG